MNWEAIWVDVNIATMDSSFVGGDEYGSIRDGALAVSEGRVAWVGRRADLPQGWKADIQHSCRGAWIAPGLIDCHTHLVHAGNRAHEFEMRFAGASYEDIARAGGGIASTVLATRAATADQLLQQSAVRLAHLLDEGVTTVEIKSGYGLATDSEEKMLRVARRLGEEFNVAVSTTFLGAHALPPEFNGRADEFIALVCEEMLPRLHAQGLVDAVDAFCEGIAFSPEQTRRVFAAARRLGLPVKLHADQLSDLGGGALVADAGGLSADHLEHVSENSVRAMADAGIVAVLLPGAFYFLRETRKPPIEWFRRYGVPMAVATDCNPGTSPCTSLLLMLNMACTLFGLTPAEALQGATCHAARALGIHRDAGILRTGMRADFNLWKIGHPCELIYAFGANPRIETFRAGKPVQNSLDHRVADIEITKK
jgi:imidazolonepropionase